MSRELMLLRTQLASAKSSTQANGGGTVIWRAEDEEEKASDDAPGGTDNARELEAIVNDAVNKKTERVLDKMRVKQNKKPSFDQFAKVLELSPEQKQAAERILAAGQRETAQILDTPTASGANLMNELADAFARGFANPGKDNGMGKWVGRLFTEKIPGTDQSYAERLGEISNRMKASLKQEWSADQYSEFEEWGVDPNEIQDVPGGADDMWGQRITSRARELGIELPEDDDK